MVAVKEAASAFLANKRIAVTGVSRQAQGHGSNAVYKRLRDRGYEVFAVNPNADEIEGDRCYHDLKDIPGGVDAVVIATRPDAAEAPMSEFAELGIKQTWVRLHRRYQVPNGAVEPKVLGGAGRRGIGPRTGITTRSP
jgi:uncharacterized protein